MMVLRTPSGAAYHEAQDWPWPGEPWPWCGQAARYTYSPSGERDKTLYEAIPHDAHVVNGGNTVCPGVAVTYVIQEEG